MDAQYVASPGEIAKNFLRDVFGTKWRDAWIADVPGDPGATPDPAAWAGMSADDLADHLTDDGNLYYAVAIVDGRRHRDNFVEAPVLVLDDVMSRVAPETVSSLLGEPRWIARTSPGSQQWVYTLSAPISDRTLYARVLTALKAKGLTDKGSGDVVHYMRLPVGINGKGAYGSPSPRVTGWRLGDNILDVGHLLDVLGLNGGPAPLASPRPADSGPLSARSRKERTAGSVELLRRAVAAIPNDAEFGDYDAFEAMGEAIKGAAGGDPGGLEIWLDFCARSETHDNDPDLMEAKYVSFGADHAGWASILRRVAERDAGLAETLRREGAKFKFEDTTPDDDDRADALADEAAEEAARSAALLAEIRKDHAIIRGFKGVANLRGTATRLIAFEPRDVFTQFWDQRGTLPVKGKHIPAGRAMFSGPGMLPTFEGVGMWMPGAEPAGHLNLFPSFAVSSVPGSWSTIDQYLRLILASGDPARYGFLLDWLAYCTQNPLGRALTVLCLVGLPGCGKSTLGKLMRMIFGHRLSIAATSEADLFGNFNGRLEHALFIHADEAFFGPDPRIRSTFKALVTEPTLRIEEKHETAREVPNRTKMLVTSNEAAALPLEPRDRRSTVFTVSDAWIGDKTRWDALHHAIDNGDEVQAFLHALLQRDLTKFNPRRPHGTIDKVQMALAGSDPVTQFIKSAIDRGALPGADETAELSGKVRADWTAGPITVLRSEFYDEFERWAGARQRRASFIPNATAFGAKLRSLIPDINRGAQKARIGGTSQNVYVFPSLEETERALLAALGAGDEAQQGGGTAPEGGGTEKS
ncbi:MAG: DUF5906 domain-containing protein [Siculibacillus sp.]|nr:DUF5906 domain-containing protein [Siculibacillus sp.]